MSDDEANYILCSRVQDGPPHVEAVQRHCTSCDAHVWLSLSSADIIKSTGAIPICGPCAVSRYEDDPDAMTLMPPDERQIAAIRRYLTNQDRRN